MSRAKKYLLFLFVFSAIQGMEEIHSSHLLQLPDDILSHIVYYCDNPCTVNNLLRSHSSIYNFYKTYTGTITESSLEQIYFGIDRIIYNNPSICASLSNASHLKGRMHYAQKYGNYATNKTKIIFETFCKNATYEQTEQHISLCTIFEVNKDNTIDVIDAYQGKKPISKNFGIQNKAMLPIAIDICLTRPKTIREAQELFFLAIENNIISHVEMILDKYNIDINKKNNKLHTKQTALHIAIEKEYIDIVNLLLNHKAINPNKTQAHWDASYWHYFLSPLSKAVFQGKIEIVTLLLKHPNIDVNLAERKHQDTALHIAIEKNHYKILKLLLKHDDIDPNRHNEYGYSPLALAVEKNVKMVRILLKHNKSNVNTKSNSGDTLLHSVTFSNTLDAKEKLAIANLLMEHQNIAAINELSKCLLKRRNSRTPLYQAVINNHIELVELFLKHQDIDPNIICHYNKRETALHAALRHGYIEIANLLLNHPKTNIFIPDKKGDTAYDLLIEHPEQELFIKYDSSKTTVLAVAITYILVGVLSYWFHYKTHTS